MKTALVCGAGGFIGGHLVKRLKAEGYWVRGVDIKYHEFAETQADEFWQLDLREIKDCIKALWDISLPFHEVYQLAADMGGMGFIHSSECDIMYNNALINANMIREAARSGVKRYFFSSSVCVYRDMQPGEQALIEEQAYPAQPDNEYGWEKLYAERMALAYGRNSEMAVRVARFENTYGPEGTWYGGREKAPAALCRKVALAPDNGLIEVWGDGSAERVYTYVDDTVDGIYRLMQSDIDTPVNIGGAKRTSVNELVDAIITVSGKCLAFKHIDGPVGVQSRNFSKAKICSLGWQPRVSLQDGIARTYKWIEEQVKCCESLS